MPVGQLTEDSLVVVERYVSFDGLADREAEWDAFVKAAGGDVYATFAWCRTWWSFYGDDRRLALLLFRQNDRLVGIFPLFFETVSLAGCPVRFVRLVACDHSGTTCSPVIEAGMERAVVGLLSKELTAESFGWDVLQLGPLPGYARRIGELESAVREHFSQCRIELEPNGCHTVFDLPDSPEAYLSALSAKERSHIRQDERRLQRSHVMERICHETPDAVIDAFGRFLGLHEAVWRAQGKLGHFRDWPEAACFHRALISALARHGRVYISELLADARVIACNYGFRFGRFVHWFLTARGLGAEWDRVNVGRALFVQDMRLAIESGASLVDGLGGHYEYKLRLGGRITEKRAILVFQQDASARVRSTFFRWAAWVLNKAYRRVWFARLGPRLGLLRGPLWRSWIRSRM